MSAPKKVFVVAFLVPFTFVKNTVIFREPGNFLLCLDNDTVLLSIQYPLYFLYYPCFRGCFWIMMVGKVLLGLVDVNVNSPSALHVTG